MKTIALTGGYATGKSTVAKQLVSLGATFFDMDKAGHRILESNPRVSDAIARKFPETVKGGKVDRTALGNIVFKDKKALHWLEALLHPEIFKAQDEFIKTARRRNAGIVVVEVPLLFEIGAEKLYDLSILVGAPAFLQRQRALARPHMTEKKLNDILSRQWSFHRKKKKADKLVFTGTSRGDTIRQVKGIWNELTQPA